MRKYSIITLLFFIFTLVIPVNTFAADQQVTLWDGTTYSVGNGQNGELVVNSNTTINGGQYTNIKINNGATLYVGSNPIYVAGSITGNGSIRGINGANGTNSILSGGNGSNVILYVLDKIKVPIYGANGGQGYRSVEAWQGGGYGGNSGKIKIYVQNIETTITGGTGGSGGSSSGVYNDRGGGKGGDGEQILIYSNKMSGNITGSNGGSGGTGYDGQQSDCCGGSGGNALGLILNIKELNGNINFGNGGSGGSINSFGSPHASGGRGGDVKNSNNNIKWLFGSIRLGVGGSGGKAGYYGTYSANGTAPTTFNIACATQFNGSIYIGSWGTQVADINISNNDSNTSLILTLKDYATATINSNGPVRFKGTDEYALASYWNSHNVTVNNLRVKNPDVSSEVNSSGLNTLKLGDFYNVYGGSQSFDFIIERCIDGIDSDYTQVDTFTKPLSSSLQWIDWNTVAKKDISYRIGFRKSLGTNPVNKDFANKSGFIFVEPFVITSRSEGGSGVKTYANNGTNAFKVIKGTPFVKLMYGSVCNGTFENSNKSITVTTIDDEYSLIEGKIDNPSTTTKYGLGYYVLDTGLTKILFEVLNPPNLSDTATVTFE